MWTSPLFAYRVSEAPTHKSLTRTDWQRQLCALAPETQLAVVERPVRSPSADLQRQSALQLHAGQAALLGPRLRRGAGCVGEAPESRRHESCSATTGRRRAGRS